MSLEIRRKLVGGHIALGASGVGGSRGRGRAISVEVFQGGDGGDGWRKEKGVK